MATLVVFTRRRYMTCICRLTLLATLALLITACDKPDPRVAQHEQNLADLTQKIEALEKQVEAFEEDLEREKGVQDILRNWEKIAYLTPGDEGYSVIEMDLGRLTMNLVDVRAYANGSRVTLQIGNLTSATIEGAKGTIEWGRVDKDGTPDNESAKSREMKFSESLQPGRWTKVEVVLEGVPPSELGWLRVKNISHSAIKLY